MAHSVVYKSECWGGSRIIRQVSSGACAVARVPAKTVPVVTKHPHRRPQHEVLFRSGSCQLDAELGLGRGHGGARAGCGCPSGRSGSGERGQQLCPAAGEEAGEALCWWLRWIRRLFWLWWWRLRQPPGSWLWRRLWSGRLWQRCGLGRWRRTGRRQLLQSVQLPVAWRPRWLCSCGLWRLRLCPGWLWIGFGRLRLQPGRLRVQPGRLRLQPRRLRLRSGRRRRLRLLQLKSLCAVIVLQWTRPGQRHWHRHWLSLLQHTIRSRRLSLQLLHEQLRQQRRGWRPGRTGRWSAAHRLRLQLRSGHLGHCLLGWSLPALDIHPLILAQRPTFNI